MMDGLLWNLDECEFKCVAHQDDLLLMSKDGTEWKLGGGEANRSEWIVSGVIRLV